LGGKGLYKEDKLDNKMKRLFTLSTLLLVQASADDGPGCTESTAYNYSPSANVEDGSCTFLNEDDFLEYYDGYNLYRGCIDTDAYNYNENANVEDKSCTFVTESAYDVYAFKIDTRGMTARDKMVGCIETDAYNYNIFAQPPNAGDGSCKFVTESAFDAYATQQQNAGEKMVGCTESTAYNYNPSANVEDGSCTFLSIGAVTDYQNKFMDLVPINNIDSLGCIDTDTYNYNPSAKVDDGLCKFVTESAYDEYLTRVTVLAELFAEPSISPDHKRVGCIDTNAYNYDPTANADDGLCKFVTESAFETYVLKTGIAETTIVGCVDQEAFNHKANANVDDGSCIFWAESAFDAYATQQQNAGYTADETTIVGCIDTNAYNYNENANVNDGLCKFATESAFDAYATQQQNAGYTADEKIVGCMDEQAYNYDSTVNVEDDNSCTFLKSQIDLMEEEFETESKLKQGVIDDLISKLSAAALVCPEVQDNSGVFEVGARDCNRIRTVYQNEPCCGIGMS
jgi:hypothetical protein